MINSHITASVAADRHRTLLAQARADSLASQARSSRQQVTAHRAPLPALLVRLQSALSRAQLQPAISTEPSLAAAEPSIVAWSLSRSLAAVRMRARGADANRTAELLPNVDAAFATIERNQEVVDLQSSVCPAPC